MLALALVSVVTAAGAFAQGRAPRVDTLVVDSAAILTIGARASDELFEVRGGVLWGDTVVIADAASKSLRFYLRSGKAIGSIGRSGSGPGEFQELDWIMRSGNRLVAFDSEQRRLTIFGPSRRVESTTLVAAQEPYTSGTAVGRFHDGRLLIQSVAPAPRPKADAYVTRRRDVLFVSSAGADRQESIGATTTSEYFIRANGRMGQTQVPLLFGKASKTLATGAIAVTVENRDDSIAVFTLADRRWREFGGLRRDAVIAISKAAADRIKASRAKGITIPQLRVRVAEAYAVMPVPTTMPRYGWFGEHAMSLMRGTSEGAVWIVGTSSLNAPTPVWTVVGATGSPRAIVKASSEMEILDATETVALVRTWDKDGAERVELRKLMPLSGEGRGLR